MSRAALYPHAVTGDPPESTVQALRPLESRVFGGGVVLLRYGVARAGS